MKRYIFGLTRIFLLCSLISACSFLSKVSKSNTLEYVVDFKHYEEGRVEMTILLKGYIPSRFVGRVEMNLERSEALSPAGTSVVLNQMESHGVVLIEVVGEHPATLHYVVKVGREWTYPNIGRDMGRRFGFLDANFGIMSGSNLFLIPESYSDLHDVRIRFKNIPQNWQLITTLKEEDGVYFIDPSLGNEFLAEHLHNSLIALGHFTSHSKQVNGTLITACFEKSVNGDPDKVFRQIMKEYQYLSQHLGDLHTDYKLIFVPQTPDGKKVQLDAGALGQALSILHWTRYVWGKINYNLVAAFTRFRPFGYFYKPGDLWFSEGVAQYLSLLISEQQGVIRLDTELLKSYDRYFIDPRVTFVDLQAIKKDAESFPQRDKDLLVTYILDQELKKHGQDIFRLLKEIQRDRRVVDLRTNLKNLTGSAFDTFFATYVQQPRRIISPSILPQPPPVLEPLDIGLIHETILDELSPVLSLRGGIGQDIYRIAFSGFTRSYLENCGCKLNQNGGVSRRMRVIEKLRSSSPNFLLVDVGDFFPEDQNAPYLDTLLVKELEVNIAAMNLMEYDAAAIGFSELRYSYDFFRGKLKGSPLPIVNCNVYAGKDELITVPYVTKKLGRLHATIIGVWEYKEPHEYLSFYDDALYGLFITDPVEAVAETISQLDSNQNFIIVVGNISPATARRLIDRCPGIQIIITSGRYYIDYKNIPEYGDDKLSLGLYKEDKSGFYKSTLILYANMDTYGISSADFLLSRRGEIKVLRLYRVVLSTKISEHRSMRSLLDRFYNSIERDPALRVKPLFSWDSLLKGNGYAGAQACQGCHQAEYYHWKTTDHAFAYKTLIVNHRQLYPKCVVCHVTGYGYSPGFATSTDESTYGGVQCEICHGPGLSHMRAPTKNNIRKSPPQKVCLECHTPEHSNEFIYNQRIERVKHIQASHQ